MAKKIAKKIEKKVVKTTKPVKKATKKPTVKSVVKKAVKPVKKAPAKKTKQVEEEPDFELGGEPIDAANDVELELRDEEDMLNEINNELDELPDDEAETY